VSEQARERAGARKAARGERRASAKAARDEFVPSERLDPEVSDHPAAYSLGEEIANSVTHGVGVAFSIVALTLLVVFAVLRNDPWSLAGAIVFGVALVLLYTGSTLYHAIPFPKARHVFKILDHSAIYVLIAGTYTPFTFVTLRNSGGWWMFAVVWTLAVIGIVLEAFWVYRPKWLSVVVYVGMGWLVVLMTGPLMAALPANGLILLFAGGLAYTGGTIFYAVKRVPYFHMIWHLFVIAGSVCHFLAVLLYVMPLP
jgi:hemolysin III